MGAFINASAPRHTKALIQHNLACTLCNTTGLSRCSTSTEKDIARAHQVVPGPEYKGVTFKNMSLTLDKYLSATAAVKPCDDFSAKELQELSAMLYLARDAKLDSVYSNDEVQGHHQKDALHAIQRDGHCHEAVTWYVHHLSSDVKMVLAQTGIENPLLSYDSHDPKCVEAKDETHGKVCKGYQETVLRTSCHSNALPSN